MAAHNRCHIVAVSAFRLCAVYVVRGLAGPICAGSCSQGAECIPAASKGRVSAAAVAQAVVQHALVASTHLFCLQPVLSGTAAQTVLKDALAVLEFFTTFRHLWPEDPLDLATLQHAALWPLDSTILAQLYSTLLGILLHDHVSP